MISRQIDKRTKRQKRQQKKTNKTKDKNKQTKNKQDKKTKRHKDKKAKSQKDIKTERQKDKRQRQEKKYFNIVTSGQFRTLAMFSSKVGLVFILLTAAFNIGQVLHLWFRLASSMYN